MKLLWLKTDIIRFRIPITKGLTSGYYFVIIIQRSEGDEEDHEDVSS
ncbi:MAG: hypothetical protein IPI10_08375 [Bacteroidetes bacterium]|nr:hypothetical protein [Bacteroidota bacterium]